MIQKMPMSSGGGGGDVIEGINGHFYNVNSSSYVIYNGATYNASGSPLTISIPNVLNCVYQGSNVWSFTNLTGKTMLDTRNTPITTNTNLQTPYGSSDHENLWFFIIPPSLM